MKTLHTHDVVFRRVQIRDPEPNHIYCGAQMQNPEGFVEARTAEVRETHHEICYCWRMLTEPELVQKFHF